MLTPAPPGFGMIEDHWRELLQGWRTLATRPLPSRLDPWARERLTELVKLESDWPQAARGHTLLHGDLRADNIVLTRDRVVFVDWPDASVGAPWVDLVCFLPSVAMQGGPPPWEVWEQMLGGQAVPGNAVRTMVAAFAGFLVQRSFEPPPPGLPTLRPFQAAQAEQALRWLRHLWP